jgi:hypothetical protein
MQKQKISVFALIAFLSTLLVGCAANSPIPTAPWPATPNSLTAAPASSPPSSSAFAVPPPRQVVLPEHASLDYTGHSWSCDSGYTASGMACVPVVLPEHASLDYTGHSWSCVSGYGQVGGSCVPESSPQVSGTTAGAPACSETGSCYGDISNITGLPKTTFVNGYFRSNGTYVGSYFRSR